MNEKLITEYAKKIYGFAYSKTGNCHDADDLSQDITLVLCTIRFPEKQIDNMDAYIYRVCRYTWSKYLRKNKPCWESIGAADCLDYIESDENIEDDIVKRELYEKLRREIMYLGKIRREAIIMFYYDGKSGDEISSALGIPPATLRWHLHRAKNELKERLEMDEQNTTIYRPVKLSVGHYGWYENDVLRSLESDTLMQNICYICFDNALTVTEISRTLGVAAVYLEDKLEKLCSMEYMTKNSKDKYLTNFFIRGVEYQLEHSRYQYEKTLPLALLYYNIVKTALPEIKEIGYFGDVNDNILTWDIFLCFLTKEINSADDRMIKELHLEHGAPIRPDGTRHWVRATLSADDMMKTCQSEPEDFYDFCSSAGGFGLKSNSLTPERVRSFQLDISFMSGWRTLSTADIQGIIRLVCLRLSGDKANEYDKSVISSLIEKGLASRTEEGMKLNILYFTKDQKEKTDIILEKYAETMLDRDENEKLFTGYAEHMKKYIPDCVSENERNHNLTSYDPYNAIFWLLVKNGYLRLPDEEERKYVCTVMWDF